MRFRQGLLCVAVAALVAVMAGAGCSKKDRDAKKKNEIVTAQAVTPVGPQAAEVTFEYRLIDPDSDTASVTIAYSTNGGIFFEPFAPTEFGGVGSISEGTTGLATSPFPGTTHFFVWDTIADLGLLDNSQIQLRVTPMDDDPGVASATASFPVLNAPKPPPSVTVAQTVPSPRTGDVAVGFTLFDLSSSPVSIEVEYTTDFGGSWNPATEGAGSSGVSGLASAPPPGGTSHIYVWDSQADVGPILTPNMACRLRITPYDFSQAGAPQQSNSFTVDNSVNLPPSISLLQPTPAIQPTGDVIFDYLLTDFESNKCSVTAEFSTDGGITWAPAARGPGGEPLANRTSSPGGTPHVFVWNTFANVGAALETQCRVRLTPFDPQQGAPGINPADFTVDNTDVVPPEIISVTDAATITATQRVAIEFSEPMDPASVVLGSGASATLLVIADNNQLVGGDPCLGLGPAFDFYELAGTVAWENMDQRLLFFPSVAFPADQEVRVSLTSGITDRFGNGITATNPVISAPLSTNCINATEVFENRFLPGGIPECSKYLPDPTSDIWFYDFDTFGEFDNELSGRGLRSAGATQADMDVNDLARDQVIARVLYILHDRYKRDPDTGAAVPGVSWSVSFVCSQPSGQVGQDYNRMCVGRDEGSLLGRAIFDPNNDWRDDDCSTSSPLGTFSGGISGTNSSLGQALTAADLQFLDGSYSLGSGSAADDSRFMDIRGVINDWGQAVGIVGCHETGHSVGLPHDNSNSLNIMKPSVSSSFLSSPDSRFGSMSSGILDVNLGID